MNSRTIAGWCGAYHYYIHTLVTGIGCRCISKAWSSRTVNRRVGRTCDGRSSDVSNRDGSAAGGCVATIIRCTEDSGMNRRAASAGSSTYNGYIYSLITGIGCSSVTPGWSSRAVDGRVGRTCNRWCSNVSYSDRGAASGCITTVICRSPGTCMYCRTAAAWRSADYSDIHALITGV